MLDAIIRRIMVQAEIMTVLALVLASSWAFVAWMTLDMSHPLVMMMMPTTALWSWTTTGAVFFMWTGMMVAMMLPSAAPMVLAYDALDRQKQDAAGMRLNSVCFTAAYLVLWAGFSAFATAAQWVLQKNDFLTHMIVSRSDWLTGALLVLAGVYQVTPLKHACLNFCRTLLGFLMAEWQDGVRGACIMGLKHGLYCTGCCWALMLLLFAAGVMNPVWIVFLTAFVALEKWPRLPLWAVNFVGGSLVLTGVAIILL